MKPVHKLPTKPSRRPPSKPSSPITAFRLVVEYDGSRYHGWQKQGEQQTSQGVRTVTGSLERVLHEAGLQVRTLGGSGRTDAGVHALAQVAHLHLGGPQIPEPRELQRLFDEGLPADVAVRSISTCSPNFHARHDALERSYLYQLSTRRSALAKPFIWWVKGRLDVARLKEAWMAFQGSHDASAFADLEPGEDPRVHIASCEFAIDGSLILLRATADHFLRRQVRRMVGAAVLCAQGRDKLTHILQDLQQPTPEANLHWSGKAAPAAGLFLESVRYAGDTPQEPPRAVVRVA